MGAYLWGVSAAAVWVPAHKILGSRRNAEGRRQTYLGRAVTVFRLLYGDRSRISRWLSSITDTAPAPRLFSLLACAGS